MFEHCVSIPAIRTSVNVKILSQRNIRSYLSLTDQQLTYLLLFNAGILIVVAVGVALGVLLGGLLLIFVVVYMRRSVDEYS